MYRAMHLNRIVRRHALLERLEKFSPEIIALIAPAGFGKSTLARQFIEDRDVSVVCDCADAVDDIDLARRIVPSLAEEDPEQRAALSQRELLLSDGSMSVGERAALALAAWRKSPQRSTFVFENTEHVLRSTSSRQFFTRLLAERPTSRTVMLCSRENVRVQLTRFAAPHKIVTLRPEDLAFTRAELDDIFQPLALEKSTLDRIYAISQGWPIPVLFFARVASDGGHHALLNRLGDVAFEELYEYVADQVLGTLPRELTNALFAAASIPNASAADIELATADAAAPEMLGAFARGSPFVRLAEDDTFVVHPLMSAMLVEPARQRRDALLAATARGYEERGDHLRATELHLARGDPESAARSLECVTVGNDRAPSMRYSRLLSSLDRDIVRRYPTLWCCSALLQSFSTESRQLLEETGSLWATLPPDTPIDKFYYVLATRVLLLLYLGMFGDALSLLERAAPRASIPDPPVTIQDGYALYLHGATVARMGRIHEAEADLKAAWPLAEPMDVMASAVLMLRGADVSRVLGRRDEERELLERSIEYARRSQLSNFVAFRLAEAAFGAWLAGEDEPFTAYAKQLERVVEIDGIRGLRFFAACARNQALPEVADADLTRWVLCGHLIAATHGYGPALALQHARSAHAAGEHYASPFLRTLLAIACAETCASERTKWYEDARHQAAMTHSQPLIDAVNEAAGGDDMASGFLSPFVRRLRASGRHEEPRLEISLLTGTVRARGKEVKLAERELELLFVLSRRRDLVSRDELGELLWPSHDIDSARNLLNVHLHRLRLHLGDEGAVQRSRDGLRLCDEARVDLREIDRTIAARRSREIDGDAEDVAAIYRRLCVDRPARVALWPWFEPVERYIRELRCELAQRLARYELRRGNIAVALDLCDQMIEHDPCDEAAREIAIEAHLQGGDRAAALRHYRQYRDVLIAELQCEPSPSLAARLQDAGL